MIVLKEYVDASIRSFTSEDEARRYLANEYVKMEEKGTLVDPGRVEFRFDGKLCCEMWRAGN